MTLPETPPPPDTVGTQPRNATEINGLVGTHLRDFLVSKARIGQDRDWLITVNLTEAPYYFSQDQEDLIKSGVLDLDTALDAIDMTNISRIVGM